MAFLAAIPAALGSLASGVGAAASSFGGLGSLISAGGAILSGVATANAASAQAQVAKDNAKINEENAQLANERQQEAVQLQDRQTAAALGEQAAIQGGSGLSLTGRTQLLTRKAAAALGRQDAINVNEAGAREVRNYQQAVAGNLTEANMAKASGQNALLSGFINAGSSLIGGATTTRKKSFNSVTPKSYDPWAGLR